MANLALTPFPGKRSGHPERAPGGYPLRAFLIGKFPYSIIAGPFDGVMTIVAVAHTSREPGYWRGRVD